MSSGIRIPYPRNPGPGEIRLGDLPVAPTLPDSSNEPLADDVWEMFPPQKEGEQATLLPGYASSAERPVLPQPERIIPPWRQLGGIAIGAVSFLRRRIRLSMMLESAGANRPQEQGGNGSSLPDEYDESLPGAADASLSRLETGAGGLIGKDDIAEDPIETVRRLCAVGESPTPEIIAAIRGLQAAAEANSQQWLTEEVGDIAEVAMLSVEDLPSAASLGGVALEGAYLHMRIFNLIPMSDNNRPWRYAFLPVRGPIVRAERDARRRQEMADASGRIGVAQPATGNGPTTESLQLGDQLKKNSMGRLVAESATRDSVLNRAAGRGGYTPFEDYKGRQSKTDETPE